MATLSRASLAITCSVLVAACAAPGGGPAAAATPIAAAPSAERDTAAQSAPPPIDGARASAMTARGSDNAGGDDEPQVRTGFDPAELAVWNDPSFKQRFAESFLAETEVEPRVTVVERDRLQKVMQLMSDDKLPEATAALEGMRGEAASALVDYMLANLYTRLGRGDDALPLYAGAVAKYPKFLRAWKNLGQLHFRRGDYAAAATDLARVVQLGGNDAITYGLLGYAYLERSSFVAAESAYRMATLLDPASIDWQIGLARALFKLQRYADAAGLCATLVDKYPDRADLWMHLGNANLGLGQPVKAAECYEMVDRLGKATVENEFKLGDIYTNIEVYDQAAAAYGRGLRMDDKAAIDRPLLAANLMERRGARADSRHLLDEIDAVRGSQLSDATKKNVLRLRARLALADGAGDEEARVLEEIVAMDPLDGDALILLGQHYAAHGDIDRAASWFERAAGIEAFEADALVRHAQLMVKQAKYADAVRMLRRAQTIKPRNNIQDYLERIERYAQGRS